MKLYPFQKELVDRFVDTPSVLVGDDMGLGKTFEALALDLRRRTTQLPGRQLEYPTLIVAPLSVLGVWEWHIKQLWPAARVAVINPKMRGKFIRELDSRYHYYIIHWEGVRLVEELQKRSWWHIVADEAHRMKNRKAQQTWALKKLHTNYKTALSGTPADNAPQDLWSLLNWLYPKRWTSYWSYERKHVKYQWHQAASQANGFKCPVPNCEDFHKSSFKKMVGVDYVDELHAEIAPYYMRRLKAEVISELPEKYYTQIEVDLAPKQRRIYDEMRHDMLAWIGEHEHEPIAAPIVVAQLVRLKQFALAYAELEEVQVRDRSTGEVQAKTRVRLSEPSSKLDVVLDQLQDNPTRQFVVFSESKQAINLLAARLTRENISHVVLTGDTAQADRDNVVAKFQAGRARAFLGTIHAGGEGITLTSADTVIFLDRTWNPSRNRQAEDRLHRIGQRNAVQVIDIVARDTVDGGRLQQLDLKWSWLKELLGDKVKADA